MQKRAFAQLAAAMTAVALVGGAARAACVNKYIYRQDGPKIQVTLLTGKLTFQEAKDLAKAIGDKKADPLEWVGDNGKSIAKQAGEMTVLRPMPVGCDNKTSGSVFTVMFLRAQPPAGKLSVKLPTGETVVFDEQKQ